MTDAELKAFSQELKNAADAARRLAQEHSNLLSSSARTQQNLSDVTEELGDAVEGATNQTKRMTKEQQAQAKELAKLQKEWREATKAVERASNEFDEAARQFGAESKEAKESLAKLSKAQDAETNAKNAATRASNGLDLSMRGSAKSARYASVALDWFGTSLKTQGKQLVEQYKSAGGILEGSGGLLGSLFEQQQTALTMGLSGAELQQVVNANRQVINAMGGTAEAMDELNPAVNRFRVLTGSSADAARLAGEAATSFAQKGIKPSAAAIEAYTNDMVEMRKRTGKSYDEINQLFDEVAGEADSIAILRAAREDEREAILASQRALIQQSVAAGMSAEQAKEAAKMLNKMAAAKPLDRLKQAAKIRALGGAMGVAGAEEAAQAVIAGKRMTDEQRANLNKFSQDMTNTMDTMAAQGLGSEIFGSALLEKLDLEQYYGSNSDFSTTLGSHMKPIEKAINELKDQSTGPNAELINKTILMTEQATLLLSGQHAFGTVIAGLTAAVLGLTALVQSKKLLDAFGGTGGTAAGKGGKGALLKGGLKAGVVGAGMMAANQFVDEGSTAGKILNSNAVQGAGYGAMLGSFIPGIGTLVGGAAGGAIGGAKDIYDWLVSPEQAGGRTPNEMKPVSRQKQRELAALTTDDEVKIATLSMSDGVTKQIALMDTSNAYLKQLAELSTKHIELSEKQLVAMTMSEKEKVDVTNKTNLLKDTKFGSMYGYI